MTRANAARVTAAGVETDIRVVAREVSSWIAGATPSLDLVFIDPPYELSNAALTAELAALAALLSEDAIVVVERSTRDAEPEWPAGISPARRSDYGETRLYWLEPSV